MAASPAKRPSRSICLKRNKTFASTAIIVIMINSNFFVNKETPQLGCFRVSASSSRPRTVELGETNF